MIHYQQNTVFIYDVTRGIYMIEMIASDMDGTLLNAQMEISLENQAAIQYATEQGIQFVIATGRGITEALPPLQAANISCPMITGNGAQVFDQHGQLLFSYPIDPDDAVSIIDKLNEEQLYFELATNQGVFSNNRTQRISMATSMIGMTLPHLTHKMALSMAVAVLDEFQIHYIDSYDQLLRQPDIDILKIFVFSEYGFSRLLPIQQKLNEHYTLSITASGTNNLEINAPQATKGNAVLNLAKHLNIQESHIMTLGDNINDLSMLALDGVTVAMENGSEQAKATAKYMTHSNLDHGVAYAIYQVINGQWTP